MSVIQNHILYKFFIRTTGNLLFIIGLGIAMFTYVPIMYAEFLFAYNPPEELVVETLDKRDRTSDSEDDSFDYTNILPFVPVDPEFSIIIDKIGVNAPVVKNVTTVDEKAYIESLRYGVAHAKGTSLPGEKGNMFLFAHSSSNFWQLGPYATVFNLLNKLEIGDYIIVYFQKKAYAYKVFEIGIVHGWNTTPFNEEYEEPVITLVTCDPPGSTKNRRIVKAKLL